MNKRWVLILLLLLPIAGWLLHYSYLQPAITDAFENKPDTFIKFITDNFYPRFNVEKERFDLTFFISKANQVLIRFSLVYYSSLLLIYFYRKKIGIKNKIDSFFLAETSSKNIHILRILFFSYFLYLIYQLCHDLLFMQPLKPFYKPVLWLRLLHIPFPNYTSVIIIGIIWYFLNILILLNIRVIVCSAISLCFFILIQCWEFSFEKIDHSYATMTYAFMLLPFLFEEQKKSPELFYSWSLQLIRISIAMVYFLSSLEKIFISSLSWLNPDNLKTYLQFHETALSKIIVRYDFLCVLISSFSLGIQLSFILILFFPKYKWIWIIGGILFHTGTLLIMDIGHPLNPWILVYIFFIDWTKTYDFFSKKFKKANLFSN
jgi:hypothetical protein